MLKKSYEYLLWFWLPAVFLFIQILLEIFLPQETLSRMLSENGPHELGQFIILCAAFILSLVLVGRSVRKKQFWLSLWCLLAAAGTFYVGGEEISWGQQFFDWSTPEGWMIINDQGETNLHNTSSWLDQKPRLVLMAGIIVGGLLIPLLRAVRPEMVPSRFSAIYPPPELAFVALLALAIKIADKVGEQMSVILFERGSEVEELYMYYFVLLYLVILVKKNLGYG